MLSSKKSKLKTKLLRDCVARAPAFAARAFLPTLPALAQNAPSPFLAHEAAQLLKDLFAARGGDGPVTTDADAKAALAALAALLAKDGVKTDRLRTLLEAALAVATKHPNASSADVRAAAAKVADGHASSAVQSLAAKLGGAGSSKKRPADPVQKTKKKRKA